MNENPSPSTSGAPTPDPATGSQQLAEVVSAWEARGFPGHFGAREDAMVVCFTCHRTRAATEVDVIHIDRLEGASDPDDLLVVVVVRCPDCGNGGTMVCGYGPNAGAADAEVLAALPDDPQSGSDVTI